MGLGDCIYLAMERSQPQYGFMLQPGLGSGEETGRQVTELPCCHSLACHHVIRFPGSQAKMARVNLLLMQRMCPDFITSGCSMV